MRFSIVLILILLLFGLSTEAPAEQNHELLLPLGTDEIGFPPGNYQAGVDIGHTCQVDMDSPEVAPTLAWQKSFSHVYTLVDEQGCVWMNEDYQGGGGSNSIIRLLPDGTVDWELELHPELEDNRQLYLKKYDGFEEFVEGVFVKPIVVLSGAVVCRIKRNLQGFRSNQEVFGWDWIEHLSYLICIDLDGNIRWITEPVVDEMFILDSAWRVDDFRIAMDVTLNTFAVYSMIDGAYLETVEVPGWSGNCFTGPIATDDGGWIIQGEDENGFGTPFIERRSRDGTTLWLDEFSNMHFSLPLSLSTEGRICFGSRGGIDVLDVDSGETIWQLESGSNRSCGLTPDGTFITWRQPDHEESETFLGVLDQEYNWLWQYGLGEEYVDSEGGVIVYRDGCILFGTRDGMTLLYPDGTVKWQIDSSVFNMAEGGRFRIWSLYPTVDGGIVVQTNINTEEGNDLIAYFQPVE